LAREVLFEDLMHSVHLTGDGNRLDTLVQWNKSLPSGHPLTTPVNSLYSLFTMTACYVSLTGDRENMWENTYICTYGDDNIGSASPAVAEVFNQVTIAAKMKELFGLTYTSDKKDQELVPFESMADVTFLKRGFRVDEEVPGGWAAPLAMNSITQRLYWSKSNKDPVGEFVHNMEEALLELSLHPTEVWNAVYPVVTKWCREHDIPCSIQDQASAKEICIARTDVWF